MAKKKFKISFFYRQLFAVVGINVLPLIIISGLLYSNFINDYKTNLIQVLDSKITLLAATSQSALVFEDKQSAMVLLSSLEQYKATRYAQIYDANNQLFAEFKRPDQQIDITIEDFNNIAFFKDKNVYVTQQIIMDGEYLGFIVLSADTNSLTVQQDRYIFIATWAFLVTFALAYLLNWRLQKRLTTPISSLIDLVHYVAENKRYNRRIESQRVDEIGDLIVGVNNMLDTIQAHEVQLYNRANYDELTQLPNRHLLMERLSHAIDNANRNKTEIALLFFDLDRFKIVNDSLGHTIGDELLVMVAAKLVNTMRKSDTISRWGGDEFVMLLENIAQADDIQIVVDKIIFELRKPITVDGNLLHISTSIGIARYPQDGADSTSLLKHADISMYKAKAQGPGQFRYFTEDILQDSVQRLSMEIQVRKAFEQKEFYLVYQPQISTDGGQVVGFEALIRWESDGKFIPPDKFLPVMEDVGLMYDLSLWVLNQACSQNVMWQQAGLKPVTVAVNLPASCIMHPQCLEETQSILQKTGLEPKYLEVEITENTFIGSKLIAVPVLQALRDLGVNVAIDDFGTGYSCMSYLQDLPIGTLKIDGSFIQGLGQSQANEGIVQSIMTLGQSLDMLIVAECVETEQQLDILKTMNCDIIQGYFYSKPLSVDAATDYLANNQ